MKYLSVRKAIEDKGISIRQIALKSEIASQDLYQALNGKKPFYPGWRKRVAAALEMSVDDLFSDQDGDCRE